MGPAIDLNGRKLGTGRNRTGTGRNRQVMAGTGRSHQLPQKTQICVVGEGATVLAHNLGSPGGHGRPRGALVGSYGVRRPAAGRSRCVCRDHLDRIWALNDLSNIGLGASSRLLEDSWHVLGDIENDWEQKPVFFLMF